MHMGLWHKGIDGQVFGKGIRLIWDEAKMQAAEKTLGSLRTMLGQGTQKRQGFPSGIPLLLDFGCIWNCFEAMCVSGIALRQVQKMMSLLKTLLLKEVLRKLMW